MQRILCAVIGAILWAGGAAHAASILHFADLNIGTSVVPGAISLAGHTGVPAVSIADFNAKLALGPSVFPLTIFGHHNNTGTDEAVISALNTYMSAGGLVIAASWEGTTTASALDGSAAGLNATTITTTGHPIFAGLGATISLSNPGWGTFSRAYNPLAGALCLGSLDGACAAILGNLGTTILNGPLFDTYANVGQGQQYVANQIDFLLDSSQQTIPEPASLLLLGFGLVGVAVYVKRRSAKAQ